MRPSAPRHHRRGQQLKANRRGVQNETLHRADLRHRHQLLQVRATAPRQNHAKNEKNQSDVPRHPPIRTLFISCAQVSKVLSPGSIWDELVIIAEADFGRVSEISVARQASQSGSRSLPADKPCNLRFDISSHSVAVFDERNLSWCTGFSKRLWKIED